MMNTYAGDLYFPWFPYPNRSTFQDESSPLCAHESGLHCGHMDTHDSCCDCSWEVLPNNEGWFNRATWQRT